MSSIPPVWSLNGIVLNALLQKPCQCVGACVHVSVCVCLKGGLKACVCLHVSVCISVCMCICVSHARIYNKGGSKVGINASIVSTHTECNTYYSN